MKKVVEKIKKGNKPGWIILSFTDGTHGICATDTAPFFGVGDEIDILLERRETNGKEWNLVQFPVHSGREDTIIRTSALKCTIEYLVNTPANDFYFWYTAKNFENFIKTGATPQTK